MKYFAILKDSLREALDSKMLYVMLGLLGLLILFISSMSFRSLSMQEVVEGSSKQLQFLLTQADQLRGVECSVEDLEQLNEPAPKWDGHYRFVFVISFPEGGSMTKLGLMAIVRKYREALFWMLNNPEMKTLPSPSNELRFEVTGNGTAFSNEKEWLHVPEFFFGAASLNWFFHWTLTYEVYWLENFLVGGIGGWVLILVGIIVTASSIPSMLQKGSIDLLLSKPLGRVKLLIFKYIGGLTFVLLLSVIVVGSIWLVVGLKTGLWPLSFLASSLVLTFYFAVLYSVSTLIGVLTRSSITCILVTLLVWFFLWLLGLLYSNMYPGQQVEADPNPELGAVAESPQEQQAVFGPKWFQVLIKMAHTILPRTGDLSERNTDLISRELLTPEERELRGFTVPSSTWAESIGYCLAFIAVMLGLASWRFAVRDY